jgi:signal transduction histidine kinase
LQIVSPLRIEALPVLFEKHLAEPVDHRAEHGVDQVECGRADRRLAQALTRGASRWICLALAGVSPTHSENPTQRNVEFVIADDLVCDVDGRLFEVMLENLLGNAWKFTAKTNSARVELGSIEKNGDITLYVKDNGAGFDQTYAQRLFTPFQRLHSEGEFPGTGIGLATVRRIIERHGGRVQAEGPVGGGATVYWTLPSRRDSEV